MRPLIALTGTGRRVLVNDGGLKYFCSMSICANCGTALPSQANYCAQCGQSVLSLDKPIRPVLTEMVHESLDIDGRMLLTLKTLLFKPGQLSLEYRNGRRARYTPPLRLYLVISVLFFLSFSLLDVGGPWGGDNPATRTDYYPKIMFVLLPVFALLLQALFRGTFYLSNLVFSIHIHCLTYLVFAVTTPLESFEKSYPIFLYLQLPFIVYLLSYIVLALKRYYAQSWNKIIAKSAALFLLYGSALGISFDYFLPAMP